MTNEALEVLLADIESDRVERKESISDTRRIRQAICAFANDMPNHKKPGVLFIGAKNNGACANVTITEQLLLTLSDMRSAGNILPFPVMTVQKRTLKGCAMAVVIVEPSNSPPVRFNGRIWIRVGPRRDTATADEERRLHEKRRHRDLPFDIQPLPSAPMNSLDAFLFRRVYLPTTVAPEILEENQRDFMHQLLATKLAHPGPPVCPTVLGELTVGKDPTDWIPGAYVHLLRVDGDSLGDPVQSDHPLRLPMPDLLRELETLLKINVHSAVDMTSGAVEIRKPDYPLVALQQIVRNAILHRSYEQTNAPVRIYWFHDRVEVYNPGGPFGHVTRKNFGQPGACDYRNPNLAAVLKELGYVQQFGFGISMARKAMEKNGNPPLEFLVDDTHVAVILRKKL